MTEHYSAVAHFVDNILLDTFQVIQKRWRNVVANKHTISTEVYIHLHCCTVILWLPSSITSHNIIDRFVALARTLKQ